MPLVINKVHIGPQFEYIISKCFSVSKTLFHSTHHALKLIKSQQATTSYPSDCCRTHARERRGSAHRASEWELNWTWHLRDSTQYPQPHNKFQALYIGKHIYKSFSKQKYEIDLNILLEEDADNSIELMLEECASSSHDKKQLAVKVFYAQFDLMKVTRSITLSIQSLWWIKIIKISM